MQLKLTKLAQQVVPITALLDKRPTYPLAPVAVPERKVRSPGAGSRVQVAGLGWVVSVVVRGKEVVSHDRTTLCVQVACEGCDQPVPSPVEFHERGRWVAMGAPF